MTKSMGSGIEAVQHHKQFQLRYLPITWLPQGIDLWGDICNEGFSLLHLSLEPHQKKATGALAWFFQGRVGCSYEAGVWQRPYIEMPTWLQRNDGWRIAGVNSPVRSCCRALMAARPPHPTRPHTPISKKFAMP